MEGQVGRQACDLPGHRNSILKQEGENEKGEEAHHLSETRRTLH